jgi:hypothetical protein
MLVCLESVQCTKIIIYLVVQGARNVGFLAIVWVNFHNLEGLLTRGLMHHHIIQNISEIPGVFKEFGDVYEDPPKTSTM